LVQRVWRDYGLKPHRLKHGKVSNDPRFAEKLVEIVGLYLDPPDHALVLSCDEKNQIQALDRTPKSLPLFPQRLKTLTYDDKRDGTTTLFAAIELAEFEISPTACRDTGTRSGSSSWRRSTPRRRRTRSCT
jgi:hypothetical protein